MDVPPVQYAHTHDGVSIAYQVFGAGPRILVMPSLSVHHLRLLWEHPEYRAGYECLAEQASVLIYDPRGLGMSQRDQIDFSLETMLADVDVVAEAAGWDTFAIYAGVWSGDLPFGYASSRPHRVTHLVIWRTADQRHFVGNQDLSPDAPQMMRWERDASLLRNVNWELYANVRSRIGRGWDSPDAGPATTLLLGTHTPASLDAAESFLREADAALKRAVKAPALILYPIENALAGREAPMLAAEIPGARVLGVPGARYTALGSRVVLQAAVDFVSQDSSEHAAIVVPALDYSPVRTILFTDIQDHTAMMQRLGDARGEVLREHERITREALRAHGGTEVKTIGDSFMASFASAQKAVDCAIALQRAFAAQRAGSDEPITVRIGLNAGEPIADEDDLFGSSVILAARTKEQAAGGEILVTEVVRHLVTGKGFRFADRGFVEMKGFEEPVRVYEVGRREQE
jgi:class 3 adenylate cyclase